jgi:RTX calcium-binding nonapeptide repeat (4 copies)
MQRARHRVLAPSSRLVHSSTQVCRGSPAARHSERDSLLHGCELVLDEPDIVSRPCKRGPTDGPETMLGTPANDTCHGAGGADDVEGAAGNDRLFGGAGDTAPTPREHEQAVAAIRVADAGGEAAGPRHPREGSSRPRAAWRRTSLLPLG